MPASPIHDHFIEQAGWNEGLGSPFTAGLLREMAGDYLAGGPVATLCKDWPGNPRKDALGLRILGALHHGVLDGSAPGLAAVFPGGGRAAGPGAAWPVARDWLSENSPHVARFIQRPPQTNETRRSLAMLPGFLELAARYDMPMDILELGASAGLNQNWDRFNYDAGSWQWRGGSDVLIMTDWSGAPPLHLDIRPHVRSRAACDQNPLDVNDPAEAMRLKCYTWPDQAERLDRLEAAIRLARQTDVTVEAADAEDWLRRQLAGRPGDGLTVIYHSVFLIYPPRDKIRRIMALIEEAGRAASDANPLAWLCYESEALFGGSKSSPKMHTRLKTWPGGEAKTLAQSDGHVTQVHAV